MKNVKRLFPSLMILVPLFVAAPVLAQPFEPGTTHANLGPTEGAFSDCVRVEPNRATSTLCHRRYNRARKRMEAHVYASDLGATRAETAVALFKDFVVAAAPSGKATELSGSLISMDIGWVGLIIGQGPNGLAKYKVEVEVNDRTDGTRVGYELVENREIKGEVKVGLVAGKYPYVLPSPTYSLEKSDLRSAVIPVTLKRGHAYRVVLRVETRATGATASAAEVKFDPSPGGPFGLLASERFVQWENLTITVGEDRFEALEQRVDALEEAVDANSMAIAQNTGDIATLFAELEAIKKMLQEMRTDLDTHTHTYLTGKGKGHNNTEVQTESPSFEASAFATTQAHAENLTATREVGAQEMAAMAAAHLADEAVSTIPTAYALHTSYPNPFNPRTTIRFDLPQADHVTLKVFDVQGREIATLASQAMAAGQHRITWDASGFASGTYLYRLEAGSFVQSRQMMLVK